MDEPQEAHRPGAVRLLLRGDLEYPRKSPLGKPVVGWTPTSQGFGGLFNPRGYACLRVVVQREKPAVAWQLEDLYDTVMIVENAGAIVVCTLRGRVGLVQNFRMTRERINAPPGNYVAQLDGDGRWYELIKRLGEWKWEAPAGMSPPTNETDLQKYVLTCAGLEAFEEAGVQLRNAHIIGRYNSNPAFFAHAHSVVVAEILDVGAASPEDGEMIGRFQMFSPPEVRALVNEGQLDDGTTLAALAIAGFHF